MARDVTGPVRPDRGGVSGPGQGGGPVVTSRVGSGQTEHGRWKDFFLKKTVILHKISLASEKNNPFFSPGPAGQNCPENLYLHHIIGHFCGK
jgi:hypothetical protein